MDARTAGQPPRTRSATRSRVGDELSTPAAEEWKERDQARVEHFYAQTESDYFAILNEYVEQANAAARRSRASIKSNAKWRFWLIIATGALAAINVCAALNILRVPVPFLTDVSLPQFLNAIAAIYAVCLTVAGNVESFFNYPEQSARSAEERDLLLSRYRQYYYKWLHHVEAYGPSPIGCSNAGRLYGELVTADHELRHSLKQLADVQTDKKRSRPTNGGTHAP